MSDRDYDGLVKRLLAGPWERHTDTGRVADDAPLDAAAAIMELQGAASALIADVRRRYPGEELRCEFMRALDAAITRSA